MPSEQRGEPDTRRAILNAAAYFLSHSGYEFTTLRRIAERAGIKAGSIYHFFPSKDAIVGEVINEGVEVVHEAVESALQALPDTADPHKKVVAAIHAHLTSLLHNSEYTSASIKAYTNLPESIRAINQQIRLNYDQLWRDILKDLASYDALPDVSQSSIRRFLIGAMNWTPEWYRADSMDLLKLSRDLAKIVLRPPAPTGKAKKNPNRSVASFS